MSVAPGPRITPAELRRARDYSRSIDAALALGRLQRARGTVPSIAQLRAVPDHELISTLVAYGMPLVSARAVEHNAQQRFVALRFWCDVQDMSEGDAEARARVDFCREKWSHFRRDHHISDDDRRVV